MFEEMLQEAVDHGRVVDVFREEFIQGAITGIPLVVDRSGGWVWIRALDPESLFDAGLSVFQLHDITRIAFGALDHDRLARTIGRFETLDLDPHRIGSATDLAALAMVVLAEVPIVTLFTESLDPGVSFPCTQIIAEGECLRLRWVPTMKSSTPGWVGLLRREVTRFDCLGHYNRELARMLGSQTEGLPTASG